MNLDIIKEYKHKIQKITITNNNQQSYYSYIVVKIHLDTSPSETVRFSLQENDEFIEHQYLNDYYCEIPNKVNQTITLYAHFFPSDLYTYNETINLISYYDFQNINEEEILVHNYNQNFKNNALQVQSIAPNSINGYYDPNYKNYIITNNNNETEKGHFPLSSRYRTQQNWIVPDLEDENPKWTNDEVTSPYWEALIKMPNIKMPINVFLNYEYLPTSREYHQHYYGLTSKISPTINVFEGTKINIINSTFGSDNNYRLINSNNPYDDSKSFLSIHKKETEIDLKNAYPNTYNRQKFWIKNECDNYYTYLKFENDDNDFCTYNINLKNKKNYSLQYYIYIPSDIDMSNDYSCYIAINDYNIDEEFLIKDKTLRDQWIYHEIPFEAEENNIIKIFGPNYNANSNNKIYFTKIILHEEEEYSPTLQYNDYGVTLLENNQKIFRASITQDNANSEFNDVLWSPTNQTLPSPFTNVEITIDPNKNNIENNKLIGIYGNNNTFTFNCIDTYNTNIGGTYKAAIFLDNDNTYNISDAVKVLKSSDQEIINSKIIFERVDLTNLKENSPNNEYFIKIKYQNKCYDIEKIFIQKILLKKEELKVNKVEINDKNLYNDSITINNVSDFPLKIEAQITDQNNNPKINGYCELSINETINQTTIIDEEGWVDFYLNFDDLPNVDCYTIKIEYYQQYYQSLAFKYFDICLSNSIYDKPIVPIDVGIISGHSDNIDIVQYNQYITSKKDCTLIDVDTKNHKKFKIEIFRNNVLIFDENIYNNLENSFWFINAELNDNTSNCQYLIRTGNMRDDNNNIIEDLYQTYEREFTIIRR